MSDKNGAHATAACTDTTIYITVVQVHAAGIFAYWFQGQPICPVVSGAYDVENENYFMTRHSRFFALLSRREQIMRLHVLAFLPA